MILFPSLDPTVLNGSICSRASRTKGQEMVPSRLSSSILKSQNRKTELEWCSVGKGTDLMEKVALNSQVDLGFFVQNKELGRPEGAQSGASAPFKVVQSQTSDHDEPSSGESPGTFVSSQIRTDEL